MAKDPLKELKQNRINQGFWLMYDNQAKAKKETSLMDKMAAEIRAKDEARERERHKPTPETPYHTGSLMLLRDWQSKFYHN